MPKSSPRRTSFATFLRDATPADLRAALREVHDSFPEVKAFFAARSGPTGTSDALASARAAITDEFYPSRGYGKARASVVRRVLASFARITRDPTMRADLLLHHVELGVRFTNDFGDIDEAFYSSIETSFRQATTLLTTPALQKAFYKRCHAAVRDSDGIGWGFHDELENIFSSCFPEEPK